ncbi:MAG: hypothetical protein J2P23_08740, partial [Microlunatus sp.]|nr:hypothetical protein [Microlunatus sp.]
LGIRAGDLLFAVPGSIRSMTPPAPWQWYGEQPGAKAPAVAVMARGDLQSASPQELQTALFAPQLTGRLPHLEFDAPQLSSDAETVQLRQPFGYRPEPGRLQSGVALMITDPTHAGLLVIVGDPGVVTAGMVDGILSSVRFAS